MSPRTTLCTVRSAMALGNAFLTEGERGAMGTDVDAFIEGDRWGSKSKFVGCFKVVHPLESSTYIYI